MNTSYETLEELLIELDLNPRSKIDILKKTGKKVKTNKYFVVTEDGHCHLFSKDGKLDDISKITSLYESYIRKDIKKIIIPYSIVSIKDYAFRHCIGLTNVTIPDNVTSIGNQAFYDCSELISITIPDSVTSIRDGAFGHCTSLVSVTIPDNGISIGWSAFYKCSNLTNVTIPNSVTSIGDYAFWRCNNLTSVVLKGKTMDQVRAMENYPFSIENESIISVE